MFDYDDYIENSPIWDAKRRLVLNRASGCCERCGERALLEVHHLHYETLGHEGLYELEALCEGCHEEADEERKEASVGLHEQWQRERSERLRRARNAKWSYKAIPSTVRLLQNTEWSPALAADSPITISMAEEFDTCQFSFYKHFIEVPRQAAKARSISLCFAEFMRREIGIALQQISVGKTITLDELRISAEDIEHNFRIEFLNGRRFRDEYICASIGDRPDAFIARLRTLVENLRLFIEKHLQGQQSLAAAGDFVMLDSVGPISGTFDLITHDENRRVHVWFWRTGKKRRDEQGWPRTKAYLTALWAMKEFGATYADANLVYLRQPNDWRPFELDERSSEYCLQSIHASRIKMINMESYSTTTSPLCDFCVWRKNGCPAFRT